MENIGIPKQRLSSAKKTKSWGKEVLKNLSSMMQTETDTGRSSNTNKGINYDLFNGKLNKADFEYILNPYGVAQDAPANLQHYDIISPKIQLLLGEEIKRPFNFKVVSTNPDAVTQLEEKKKELLFKVVQNAFEKQLAQGQQNGQGNGQGNGNGPQAQGQKPIETPQQIQEYLSTNYQDIREIAGQQALSYLVQQQKLKLKFNAGFKDVFIAGEETYFVGDVAGEPIVRTCNPKDINILRDADSDYIEDAQAVMEDRWMSISSVLDEFWRVLTPTEITAIEKNNGRTTGSSMLNYPVDQMVIQSDSAYKETLRTTNFMNKQDGTIKVSHFEWVSMRKIGILTSDGEDVIMGEEFSIPDYATKDKDVYRWTDEEQDLEIEFKWYWINEVWEGDQIGPDIYVNIQAKKNQRRSLENPSKCKLGYIGYIYNARNSESVSLIDRMKPFQYLYNIIYYRTEIAFAKSKGKVALMDLAQIPSAEGWDVDRWMYYLDSMGVMFINSQEEGKRGQPSQFNQFSSVDLSMGNYINQHIAMLDKIEHEIGVLSGVSEQRQGQVGSSELVGNVERSVTQSSHITEPWFYLHNEVKKRVLEALLDTAKLSWKEGKTINYVMDDMTRQFFLLDGVEFDNSEFGVFVSDSAKDSRIQNTMEQLAHAALQGGQVGIGDIVEVLQAESIQDIKRKLDKAQEKQQQVQKEMQQQQAENAQQLQQQTQQFEREKADREDTRNTEDNQTKIQVAMIGAQSKLDSDANSNGISDALDAAKLELQSYKQKEDSRVKDESLQENKRQFDKSYVQKDKEIAQRRAQSNKTTK